MKRVEVILATYNGSHYIKEQVFSILSNFEKLKSFDCSILISDDGSTDATLEIVNDLVQLDKRISLVDKEKKGGVKHNFSCLIRRSCADYVFFSDQDDLWLPDKMSIFIDRFNEIELSFSGPILVHSDLCVADSQLSPLHTSMFKYQKINGLPNFSNLIVSNSVTGCVMACNKELMEVLRRSSIESSIMHDWYAGLCASAFGVVSFIDRPLILYRQHGGNQVGAKSFALRDLVRMTSVSSKLQQIRRSIVQTKKQAEVFLSDFSLELDNDKRTLIENYVSSFDKSCINRAGLFFFKGFSKYGALRNVFFFIFYVLNGKKLSHD